MNREQKRYLQRHGELGDDGNPATSSPRTSQRNNLGTKRSVKSGPRRSPMAFFREVRSELRKVSWPSWEETKNYSFVVLFTLVTMIAYIGVLDWVFQQGALFLFK